MTALAGEMALRHLPEISQAMREHQNQHVPQDAEFFFTETSEHVILWCKGCNLGLLKLPITEPISHLALLSANWNAVRSPSGLETYSWWISLSDPSLRVKEDRDWHLEVWFDNDDQRYNKEYMVFVRAGTASIAAREARTMSDLDTLRRLFAVTPRNKEQDER